MAHQCSCCHCPLGTSGCERQSAFSLLIAVSLALTITNQGARAQAPGGSQRGTAPTSAHTRRRWARPGWPERHRPCRRAFATHSRSLLWPRSSSVLPSSTPTRRSDHPPSRDRAIRPRSAGELPRAGEKSILPHQCTSGIGTSLSGQNGSRSQQPSCGRSSAIRGTARSTGSSFRRHRTSLADR